MFWLVLQISGEIAQVWGPTLRLECEARRAVVEIQRPLGHEYRCMHGRAKRYETSL